MDNIDHSNFKRRVIYNKIPSKKMTAAYDYRVLPDFLLNVKKTQRKPLFSKIDIRYVSKFSDVHKIPVALYTD